MYSLPVQCDTVDDSGHTEFTYTVVDVVMETQSLNLNINSAQKGEVTSSYQAPSQVKQNVDEQKP